MEPAVSAVLVTRGNVPLTEILESLPFPDVVVWDNSVEPTDLAVYGRYAALERATNDIVYVQDDDCVLSAETIQALLEAYEPGVVTANMSEWHQLHTLDSVLIGHGAIFDRHLPELAFRRWPGDRADPVFLRCCDVVFTALTPRKVINMPYRYLPWSSTPDRMWKQPGFAVERELVLDQARSLR